MENSEQKKRGRHFSIVFAVLVLVGAIVFLAFFRIDRSLPVLLEWTKGLGIWGPVVMVLAFVVACMVPLPGSMLAIGSGFLFGPFVGTITASVGSTVGAAFGFSMGRTLARDWVIRRLSSNSKLAALDQAVGASGFKLVMLIRLSSIFPFAPLSYAFGVTRVSFWDHVLASWVGMLPICFAYAYTGSAARSLADLVAGRGNGGVAEQMVFWGGLVLAVIVIVALSLMARKAIKAATAAQSVDNGSEIVGK